MRCLIAMDDTDSRMGQCTTHLGYRVVSSLLSQGCVFRRFPRLVRLNPNIPFKTRGNAAVCLDFESDQPDRMFEAAEVLMRELSDTENGANSGAVFLVGDPDPAVFRPLYEAAISGMVNPRRVRRVLQENNVRFFTLGNGMGLVGASASLGFDEREDHTYELVAYRRPENCGKPRVVDGESVKRAERRMFPHTYNDYDYGSERVLITPHGPDPVFLGIRADSPDAALATFEMVGYEEELAGYMVYFSNQCTDAHLRSPLRVPLSAYSSGWLEGSVRSVEVGEGSHLYISLEANGSTVQCAVYGQAGDLSKTARKLIPGDMLRVFGGVRRATRKLPAILNIEKLEVLAVNPVVGYVNPRCDKCGGATKSEGRGKGFECRACGAKPASRSKVSKSAQRSIDPGIYLPSPGAQRHLTKQLIRYGRESRPPDQPSGRWIQTDGIRPLPVPV